MSEFRFGQLIRLKDYSLYSNRKKDIGTIISIGCEEIRIQWLTDGIKERIKSNNIKPIPFHYVKTLASAGKLKEGQWVVTDGDGSRQLENFIIGKIGEIKENNFYLWNDKIRGTGGDKEVVGFKYSWKIKLDNSKAKIAIISIEEELKENEEYCFHCKNKFLKTNMKIGLEDSNLYCNQCFDIIHFECESCEEIITKQSGKKGANDKYYCEHCWDEEFVECVDCGEAVFRDDACWSERNEEYYCDSCWNDKFTTCENCGCELISEECSHDPAGSPLCDNCWGERCTICESCNRTVWTDDARYIEEENVYLCERCYRRDAVGRYIHDYSHKPDPILRKEKWEDDLYMGIELEVNHDSYGDKAKEFIEFLEAEKISERIYLKHDSSIGDGFEVVTHPATLYYNHRNMKLNKIINWLKNEEFTAEENGKCGLHIHINREFFEENDIVKLRLFFKKNEEKLRLFSKRDKGGADDYHYCEFEKLKDKEIINNESQKDRYWAINLNSSRNTVEIRLFRSTIDYERFMAIVQFADAVSRFVKYVGITSFLYGEGKYKENSWLLFIDWCKHQNKYKKMINYLAKEKLCNKESLKCV